MRLYIIRHGDPDYENDTITPDGELEAQALAPIMKGKKLTRIYSSPLGRARKTASYTAEATGITPIILDWTKEMSHLKHPDTPYGSVAAWDIPGEVYLPLQYGEYDPQDHNNFSPDEDRIDPEFEMIGRESDKFFEGFGYIKEGHLYRRTENAQDDEQIALFCHNGFGLAYLSYLLSIPYRLVWAGFWLAPTSVSTILFERRGDNVAVPRALCIGDTSHLIKAGLPAKPHGIKQNVY